MKTGESLEETARRGLTPATAGGDETEFLEVAIIPFEQVVEMVLQSEIRDAMPVIAVLIAALLRENQQPPPKS